MLKIGITGGIGSGKSVVCRLFATLGAPVYDSDTRAKWVMTNDDQLRDELRAAFGPDTFDDLGHLNRTYLARVVFADPGQLGRLNALVHPAVGRDFAQWAAARQAEGHRYILKEAALLYESGAYQQLDEIITVFAPVEVRQARILTRDPHRTPDDIQNIIGKQMSEEEKMQRANHVVYNDDAHLLIPQVLKLHETYAQ
ncbi:dephospho-CoA kinase [Hymenobacter taeanensis]|uniref:Dephospho-CoA kinase n=1 Tax=Hymenobacter taeanensis TaxID=2735321 RepID=A0A6M6BFX1_9BACT|nr:MULTISPECIES: dephospho-CoA kinase [Hymenobacter]QJX46879.1 dephospho-CoA kinase [Hymenobacter taeanensis]UOQ80751.1 dephospho-CoA kinase [Hymenobacter sp. 5414T-23]